MNFYWLIILPVLFYFIFGLGYSHRLRANKFIKREDISFETIYKEYFKDISQNKAEDLWNEAAKALRIPATKLRPQDSFEDELSYCLKWFPFVDLNDDFFHIAYKQLNENKVDGSLAKKMKTLGDYINLFSTSTKVGRGQESP